VLVWKIRVKIIRTALCYGVYDSCAPTLLSFLTLSVIRQRVDGSHHGFLR